MQTKAIGKKQWIVTGGHIPLESNGPEPEFTSYDKISILNTGEAIAEIELTIYYSDIDPVGPYRLNVAGMRVCHVRFNDLIDPLPVPLGTDFSCLLTSSVPVVVQFTRQDTSTRERASFTTLAYHQA